MRREVIFEMKSTYRDRFRIEGYWFGEGKKTLAIVGTMRGDEVQQQYVCARLVNELMKMEEEGALAPGHSILVIPSCNPFSMNVSKRFWVMDGTDINRMFPGYAEGETTQRIAAAVFQCLQGFEYGLQMASFYVPGDFVPHARMLRTGYEDVESAKLFGLPFVTVRKPLPFDTTLLNYNWQIWNTKAFSIYAGHTSVIDAEGTEQTVAAIKRFLFRIRASRVRVQGPGYASEVIDEERLLNVAAGRAGIFVKMKQAGDEVKEGEVMARILHANDCTVLEEIKAPVTGTVFFSTNRPLTLEHGLVYRILPASPVMVSDTK